MYSKILVPLALDHGVSQSLFSLARGLLNPGGEITALHVVEAPFGLAQATQGEDLAKQTFERAKVMMQDKVRGQAGITSRIVEGHVYRSILSFAEENGVTCIVMGSHKPGLSDYLIGSTAARVVRHARCSVHVHRA